jgi:hypothetical protein
MEHSTLQGTQQRFPIVKVIGGWYSVYISYSSSYHSLAISSEASLQLHAFDRQRLWLPFFILIQRLILHLSQP